MGSSLGSTLANIIMNYTELKVNFAIRNELLYLMYVDDFFWLEAMKMWI